MPAGTSGSKSAKVSLAQTMDETGERPPVPDHWPNKDGNLYVDCSKRAPWLPQEWGQGVKVTKTGGTLPVYISPKGKVYYHKKTIEEQEGVDWSYAGYPPMDGLGRRIWYEKFGMAEEAERLQDNGLELPAHWPRDCHMTVEAKRRVPWLPADWGQGWKETSSGRTLQCYIGPDGTRLFHRKEVERRFFNGQKLPEINLATNGRGDPVVDLHGAPQGRWRLGEGPPEGYTGPTVGSVAEVLQLRQEAVTLAKSEIAQMDIVTSGSGIRKRKRAERRIVTSKDYHGSALSVAIFAPGLQAMGFPGDLTETERAGQSLRASLAKRGFSTNLELLVAFDKSGDTECTRGHVDFLCGFYYRLPCSVSDKPCYQKIENIAAAPQLICHRLYLRWSHMQACWMFGSSLEEEIAGYAFSENEAAIGLGSVAVWQALNKEFYN